MASYGMLSKRQKSQVKHFVKGRVVHDLGAGNGALSHQLVDLGARQVVAVDKEDRLCIFGNNKITKCITRFDQYQELIDVAFLSWPSNWDTNIHHVLQLANFVIYLGKNTDGTMCGYDKLFQHLLRRKLLAYVPDRLNCLIVVGERLATPRQLTGEEWAHMHNEFIQSFEESEKHATSIGLQAAE